MRHEGAGVEPQRTQLASVDVQHHVGALAPRGRVLDNVDISERRAVERAALLGAQRELAQHFGIVGKFFARQLFVEQAVEREAVGRVGVLKVSRCRLVNGEAYRFFLVHGAHFTAELVRERGDFLARAAVRLYTWLKRERVRKLCDYVGLFGFFGVQFEAEVAYADCPKPIVHDGQRRHFFGDEQHALASIDIVRDDVGYRLAFAGARRSVQHETFVQRVGDCGILRRVRADG